MTLKLIFDHRTADNFGVQNIHIVEDFQPGTKPEEMFRKHGSRTTASKGADNWSVVRGSDRLS